MGAYIKAGTPGPQHEMLATSAGKYALKIKSWHEPGGPAIEETGTATRTMTLEGRVLVEDAEAQTMAKSFTGSGMMGYDNISGRCWSTWTDSISTGIMVIDGGCDAKRVCTFTGSWNDPIEKGPKTVRMTTRWTDAKTQILEMYGPGKDGKEVKMMEITYSMK